MTWLNYHHLLYFWTVAREGGVSAACRRLHLAQPTISGQIRALERALGHRLLERRGRGLVLTEMGRSVFRYADEIFTLGRDLMDEVRGRAVGRPIRFVVGVSDALPKLLVHRLLAPVLKLPEPLYLSCLESDTADLLARLARHDLDVVLTDAPVSPATGVRAHSHLLGRCAVSVFAVPAAAGRYRRGFPRSLDGAPFLMPGPDTMLRRSLEYWFETAGIRPMAVGEFADSALLKVFGQNGLGLFACPSAVEPLVERRYAVRAVGRLPGLREEFYAISPDRRATHPGLAAITRTAREGLLAT